MTIKEIEEQIKVLNELLENERRKAEKSKDLNVGKYYKVEYGSSLYNPIGKIIDLYRESDNVDYICDEIYYDTDYNVLRNETDEYRNLKDLVLIPKEEFCRMLEEKINTLVKKFVG